ncbi:MAG: hypothetical protein VB078_11925 [Clostridiaceae bacterium]|nr:hypothetical protein [Clostridiaceae bacterium]
MAISMGLGSEAASGMSKKIVELASAFAYLKGIGVDKAGDALMAVFTGQADGLEKLGISMD